MNFINKHKIGGYNSQLRKRKIKYFIEALRKFDIKSNFHQKSKEFRRNDLIKWTVEFIRCL